MSPRRGVVCPKVGRVEEMSEEVSRKCSCGCNCKQVGATNSGKTLCAAKLIQKNTDSSTAC